MMNIGLIAKRVNGEIKCRRICLVRIFRSRDGGCHARSSGMYGWQQKKYCSAESRPCRVRCQLLACFMIFHDLSTLSWISTFSTLRIHNHLLAIRELGFPFAATLQVNIKRNKRLSCYVSNLANNFIFEAALASNCSFRCHLLLHIKWVTLERGVLYLA